MFHFSFECYSICIERLSLPFLTRWKSKLICSFRKMYKFLVLLSLVAVTMAAETVQKRQVFLSSYPGAFNTVSYGGFPSTFYGGSPFVYGSPFFGSPFVTFEQPKDKKEGEEKKEEMKDQKKEEEKKEEKKEDEKKGGEKKEEARSSIEK
ncbi:hypothetical protein PMAYCL1PPCAC_19471 [Pristionchus mayeri]|uniref:Uncharacterized protein n=1 Tax=Pristionchus mayeri TaxID=1317129 RepID=A0AAN5I363_9BILA|nr:hypothetical protein PMAYCL1PPCAC_19471 [Pristionchus mayeri]